MRRIFKIFCIFFILNLYAFKTGSVSGVPLGFTTVGVALTTKTKATLSFLGVASLSGLALVPFLSLEMTDDSFSASTRQYIKKYKKKYILTKDSLKECDDDKNSEVCYRYARIFNLLKYEEEAKKYYDLSCKYGLDIACDIDMQEDLKRENTTNYLKEYDLDDEIKEYDLIKQKGEDGEGYCNILAILVKNEKLWWSFSNVGRCYARYEYALEQDNEDIVKYYKHALCMYGYEKYCDKEYERIFKVILKRKKENKSKEWFK